MNLTDSCRFSGMNCFADTAKVDMEDSEWDPDKFEVWNKWAQECGGYYTEAVK